MHFLWQESQYLLAVKVKKKKEYISVFNKIEGIVLLNDTLCDIGHLRSFRELL